MIFGCSCVAFFMKEVSFVIPLWGIEQELLSFRRFSVLNSDGLYFSS